MGERIFCVSSHVFKKWWQNPSTCVLWGCTAPVWSFVYLLVSLTWKIPECYKGEFSPRYFAPWGDCSQNSFSEWEEEWLPCRWLSLAPWAPACCQEAVGMQPSNLHGGTCCSKERMALVQSCSKASGSRFDGVWKRCDFIHSSTICSLSLWGVKPEVLWMLGRCSTTDIYY